MIPPCGLIVMKPVLATGYDSGAAAIRFGCLRR
jgi:hypothetical protein